MEALISKQEEKLTKGFQSLTKRVSNMKVLAKKAEKALEKRKSKKKIEKQKVEKRKAKKK